MDKKESLDLYAKGKDAWNAWAEDLLTRRKCQKPRSTWMISKHQEESKEWKDEAKVDFTGHNFDIARFSGFIFPDRVLFNNAEFNEAHFDYAKFEGYETWFTGAVFYGESNFDRAVFESYVYFNQSQFKQFVKFEKTQFKNLHAYFQDVVFEDFTTFESASFWAYANFQGAKFLDWAFFRGTTFGGSVEFDGCVFEGPIHFWNVIFECDARFDAVQVNSSFTLSRSRFHEVPDFQQTTFVHPPRLDDIEFPKHSFFSKCKSFFEGDSDLWRRWRVLFGVFNDSRAKEGRWKATLVTSKYFFTGELESNEDIGRWRALKRLAVRGNDHMSEQLFFRGELLARRGVTDRCWHASFWFGIFYQIFSDFGRSLVRPLVWWALR